MLMEITTGRGITGGHEGAALELERDGGRRRGK